MLPSNDELTSDGAKLLFKQRCLGPENVCNSQLNERGIVIPTKSFIRDVIGGSFGKVEEDSFNATSQQHRRCCRRNFAAFKNVSLRATKWKQFAKKNEKIVYKKKFQS